MLGLDLNRLAGKAEQMSTEELLDRVTVYRGGMEPAALEVLTRELHRREVTATQIRAYEEIVAREVLWEAPDLAVRCSFCRRPAIRREKRWHRLLGLLPLFPVTVAYCKEHVEGKK